MRENSRISANNNISSSTTNVSDELADVLNVSLILSDDSDTESVIKTTKAELNKYIEMEKSGFAEFFSKYTKLFPRVYQAAKLLHMVPASSVSCERLFSHAEFQVKIPYSIKKRYISFLSL